MSKKIKTVTGKDGREIEVVTRAASKKRLARDARKPLFGGPESVIGERVQKDLDNALIYAALGEMLNPKEGEG